MSALTDKVRIPTLEGQKKQVAALEAISQSMNEVVKLMGGANGTFDDLILANLDGTKEKYEKMQQIWFNANGAKKATPEELTELVTKWYKLTRELVKDWDGWTRFAHPDVLSVSTGTKMGSNADMVCEPSTETVKGRDDYAGNPLFAITYCNWKMVNSKPVITAIKDVSPDFSFYDKDKYVGVLQMSAYVHWTELEESSDHYDRGYCASMKPYSHIEPLPESVEADGTMREWVLHGACAASYNDDGTYSECYGREARWRGMNHNNMNAITAKTGVSFSCVCDWSFLKIMTFIKYASLTLDDIMNGCFNYYYSDVAKVAETGVKRVLLDGGTSLTKYAVGSSVVIDNWNGTTDDWSARNKGTKAITGEHSAKITDIKKVTVEGTDYVAVYVDTPDVFDTSTQESAVTKIYTWQWETGSTVGILGNDGAKELTSSRCAIKLQGIELSWGQYEVFADCILNLTQDGDDYYYQPFVVKDVSKRATSVTGDYKACNVIFKSTGNWQYIKHEKYSNGYYFPDSLGGTSSTHHRDAIWTDKVTGVREVLAFGHLGHGVGLGGLSCLNGYHSLGGSDFAYGSRLSPNGTRG